MSASAQTSISGKSRFQGTGLAHLVERQLLILGSWVPAPCAVQKLFKNEIFILFFVKDFISSWERHTERERERERGRDTGGGRSRLHAGNPMWNTILGLQDHAPGQRQALNRWATRGSLMQGFWVFGSPIRYQRAWDTGKDIGTLPLSTWANLARATCFRLFSKRCKANWFSSQRANGQVLLLK